ITAAVVKRWRYGSRSPRLPARRRNDIVTAGKKTAAQERKQSFPAHAVKTSTHRTASHRTVTHHTTHHRDATCRGHASFRDEPHGILRAGPGGPDDRHRVPPRCRSPPHG